MIEEKISLYHVTFETEGTTSLQELKQKSLLFIDDKILASVGGRIFCGNGNWSDKLLDGRDLLIGEYNSFQESPKGKSTNIILQRINATTNTMQYTTINIPKGREEVNFILYSTKKQTFLKILESQGLGTLMPNQ